MRMQGEASVRDDKQSTVSNLVAFDRYLESVSVTPTTGWRWRRRGWIKTVNIAGRVYVERSEIADFERRAAAGEFSQVHRTPVRKRGRP